MCFVLSWTRVVCDGDGGLLLTWSVVGESRSRPRSVRSHLNQMTSFVACAAAVYLASVLERATEVCFFEDQLTAAPPSMKMKPDMDLQSFTSLAQLASTNPCSVRLPGVPRWKMRHLSLVALRYWNARSSTCWCSVPGLAECHPRAATMYVRSGCVPNMGYISALMALWYNLTTLTSISGELSLVKCSFARVGVLIGRMSDFLNLSRISSVYFCWEIAIQPALRLCVMCMPKIQDMSPRSVIS